MSIIRKMLKKIPAIIGPTCSAKTSLAIKLAKLIDGEIIIDQMLVDEQFAWVNNVQEDKLVRHAMLLGKFIEIKGKAVSGQAIRDVYLLKGFEASVRAAQSACSEIKDDFEMYQASWSGSN